MLNVPFNRIGFPELAARIELGLKGWGHMGLNFPNLGTGVGLRSVHYKHVLEHRPKVDWFEVISENFMGLSNTEGGQPLRNLEKFRALYPVVLHGVSLSIGSVDPLNVKYLHRLKELAEHIQPAWISDHLCWTGVGGENLHDLLPLPYTQETLTHLIPRIQQVQEFLKRPLVLENVSSYVSYSHSEMSEWEFLSALAKASGCGLLVDVNNIYVSAFNHRFDPEEFLRGIPADHVAQFHLAGHANRGTHLIDTHDHAVAQPVWDLYASALEKFGPKSTLIEWDENIPDFDVLMNEAKKAQAIQKLPRERKNETTVTV